MKKGTLADWGRHAVGEFLHPGELLTALAFAQEGRHPLLEDGTTRRLINAVSPKLAYVALTSDRLLLIRGSVKDARPAGVALEAPRNQVGVKARARGWVFERVVLDFAGEIVTLKVRRDWWSELASALSPLGIRSL